jgi:hypothetical protein
VCLLGLSGLPGAVAASTGGQTEWSWNWGRSRGVDTGVACGPLQLTAVGSVVVARALLLFAGVRLPGNAGYITSGFIDSAVVPLDQSELGVSVAFWHAACHFGARAEAC